MSVGAASELQLAHEVLGAVTGCAIIATDRAGTITVFNPGAEQLLGYAAQDVIGRQTPLLFHDAHEVAARAAELGRPPGFGVLTGARGGEVREWTYVRSDGARVPVRLAVTAITDHAGRTVGYVGVATDLTTEHSAKAENDTLRRRFELLIENVEEYAIVLLDPQGTIISWNAGARRMKGWAQSEIVGRSFTAFYPPEDQAAGKPQAELARAAAEGRVVDEGWRVRRDGSRFWASVTITALRDRAGVLTGFGKITHDLTERRRQEEIIARHTATLEATNAELVRSNAELDAFAYTASHDLTEPLRGLHNYAQFVLEDHGDDIGDDGREMLDAMVGLTHRMQAVVDSLLKAARLRAVSIAAEDVDLDALITSVAEALAPELASADVAVEVPHPLGHVVGDRELLNEVLLALIANAAQYARADAHPRRAVVTAQRSGEGWVDLEVADNGIGIAAEHREVVFEPFRRLHARDARGGGVGAGLNIVRRIVERLGGSVTLQSELGVGTTVTVHLPQPEPRP